MEPITLCGLVIVAFGFWIELEPAIMMAFVKISSKNKGFKTIITPPTVQKPVYTLPTKMERFIGKYVIPSVGLVTRIYPRISPTQNICSTNNSMLRLSDRVLKRQRRHYAMRRKSMKLSRPALMALPHMTLNHSTFDLLDSAPHLSTRLWNFLPRRT